MASATAVWGLPYPQLGDAANIETAVKPLADRLETILQTMFGFGDLGMLPIGAQIPYAGTVLPASGAWDWADGGLIDKTTYAGFFSAAGHAYNGGVDPGSNKVRKPDKRGRSPIGADSFGTATGAANRLTTAASHNNARGQNGGEERHTQTSAELPVHGHRGVVSDPTHTHLAYTEDGVVGAGGATAHMVGDIVGGTGTSQPGYIAAAATGITVSVDDVGSSRGTPFNLLHPYEVDLWIVKIK